MTTIASPLFAFGSHDHLGSRDESDQPFQTDFDTQFHRVDLRYDHTGKDGEHLRVATTVGYDDSANDEAHATDTMLAARLEYQRPIFASASAGSSLFFRSGADASYDRYRSSSTDDRRSGEQRLRRHRRRRRSGDRPLRARARRSSAASGPTWCGR